jgi:dTDP-4-amino-4,6-dideoxygalactose transaminase
MVDLAAQNRDIREFVAGEIGSIRAHRAYVGDPQVAAFDKKFAEYLGVRRVVTVSSGTDAIRLALQAAEIGPGAGVITTPLTFIAHGGWCRSSGRKGVSIRIGRGSD